MRPRRPLIVAAAAVVLIVAACDGDDDNAEESGGSTTVAATSPATAATSPPTAGGDDVVAGAAFPEARCAANEAAGTIRYLSGFDFAATPTIVDVVLAEQAGYYDDLCLDVELTSSFSVANYDLVAGGEGDIAGGGSFSEVVTFATSNDIELVAVTVEGGTAIDSLILKPGTAASLEDLQGSTIGVKTRIPPSVAAMLAGAGLIEGTDYQTVLLDGFDPVAHYNLDGIVGFPGYKSNEPGTLERNGLAFDLFDPTEYDVPGSFGVLFTTREWAEANPTALQDFLRATMRGLVDATADPEAAVQTAFDAIEAGGNPNFLSEEGELFRWRTESAILAEQAAAGPLGVPDVAALQEELDAYAGVGLFGGTAPDAAAFVLADPIAGVYDGTEVIWPS